LHGQTEQYMTLIIHRIDKYPRKLTSEKKHLPSFLFQ
jgi:hypothetical protein